MKPLGEDTGARAWKVQIGKKTIITPVRGVMRSEINWYRNLTKNGYLLAPLPKGLVEVHRVFDSVEAVSELRTKNGPLARAINTTKNYLTTGFADSIRVFRPEIRYNRPLPPEDGAMIIELQYHLGDRLDLVTIPDPSPGSRYETYIKQIELTLRQASMWLNMLNKPIMPIIYPTGDLDDFKKKLEWVKDTGFGCVGFPVSQEIFQYNRSNFEYLKNNYNNVDLWIHGFEASTKWGSKLPAPSFIHALPFFSIDSITRRSPAQRGYPPPPKQPPKIESILKKDYFISDRCEYNRLGDLHELDCRCPICNKISDPIEFAKSYLQTPTASLQIHDLFSSRSEFGNLCKFIQDGDISDYLKTKPKIRSIVSQKTLPL